MAPRKTNRRIRRARISSGGRRSRSSLAARGRACPPESLRRRDGCFGTRDVYYGVAADATQHAVEAFLGSARVSRAGDRVLAIANFAVDVHTSEQTGCLTKDHFGATPKPTRETRVLPSKRLCVRCAGNARSESIAAAETSRAQERRAARPRWSPARERSCHLSGYYRRWSGDRCHLTGPR